MTTTTHQAPRHAGPAGDLDPDAPFPRSFAVVTGKGGVGKTSITANVAGMAAAEGYRVLAVDLDRQGNLGDDFGYNDRGESDSGAGLINSLWRDQPLNVLSNVRPNLDVIPGGFEYDQMLGALDEKYTTSGLAARFRRLLHDLVTTNSYDLVFFDCPPGDDRAQPLALRCARYVVIPTKTDASSIKGPINLGQHVVEARKDNPHITYLGVIIFAHNPQATTVSRTAQKRLQELLQGTVPVFETTIRHSERTANDARDAGKLIHEVAGATGEQLALLREYSTGKLPKLPRSLSGTSMSLAGDYDALTYELFSRMVAAEQATGGGARLKVAN